MQHVDSDNNSSDYEAIFQDDFTDIDSSSDIEEILNSDSDEENKLLFLTKMGFSEAEASVAMERCGPDSSIAELTDFICADQMVKAADVLLSVEDQITQRTLLKDAIGSPYFYYENVALAQVNVWTGISHDVEAVFYYLGISLKIDVQELNDDRLEQLMSRFVEFDLVVGGIQRNNLTGRNKHHQDELEDFCCNFLKDIMDIILTNKVIGIEEVAIMYQDLSQHHGITRVQVDFGKVGSFKLVQYVASASTNLKKRLLCSSCKDASRFQNLRMSLGCAVLHLRA
ncbi:hypothetical protein F3Y22_tig00016066pilonHSYRG00097 [Hibiscus syriacus]|uniref:DNA (Cytosine-5)-methyltransferase DRM1/2 n=1 Tax=Hibiscus syriacus TaxID=106335 RepID=A0A6A3C2T2_HIBSY|nr:hypothetical protein F3Y22_tig00016066pilonHSYRG00097 [Hibiscus syriacus]